MKKLDTSVELELDIYYEKLDNDLEIYAANMPKKDKYFLSYITYFGSITTEFESNSDGKKIKTPDGVAHFLEHKMFEMESGEDVFSHFATNGTDCNAYTNYDSTRYIAVGSKNFKDDLEYLIHYVNSPYFTDSNIEKEKGIIKEEIRMYMDDAYYAVEDTLRKNLYKYDNHGKDIAGEESDIDAITKEDIEVCYDNFYSPNNMSLVVAGNFDMNELESVIESSLKPLKNKYQTPPEIIYKKEPISVVKKKEIVKFNVTTPKLMIGIKTPKSNFKLEDEVKLSLYIGIILRLAFGNTSAFNERVTLDNLMTKFYTDYENIKDYITIYLYADTTKPEALLKEIYQEFKNIKITLDDLNRMKKVLIASEIKQADYVEEVNMNISNLLTRYHKFINDPVSLYKSLNLKEARDVLKNIEWSNKSCVIYNPEDIPLKS